VKFRIPNSRNSGICRRTIPANNRQIERISHIMRDIIKKDSGFVDNFEGWEDGVEGDDRPEGAGIIQGVLIKFTNEAAWETRDGDVIDSDLELIAVDITRVVQKWCDGKPEETIILEPGQKFPDIEEMNEKIPRDEWAEGPDGQLRGPWQAQHILYLLDPATMDKFSFPTGTTGGKIAIGDLRDKILWMRRTRGSNVYAVVTLSDTHMKTRFGGRQRPHFKIVKWTRLGGGEGGEVQALPPPTPTPAPATASEVQEPSLKEDLNDSVDNIGNDPPKKPVKAAIKPNRKRVSTLEAG
jgi:hypothetical protein